MNVKNEALVFGQKDYEIVKREVKYSGLFTLALHHIRHRLFNGGWSETYVREVLERFSASAILPYDPILDRIILIEQFRAGGTFHTNSPWLIEIPAGVLDSDISYEELARHEAEEEAGCIVTDLLPINDFFVSPGGSNEYLHLYCGRIDATHVGGVHGLKNEHEDIRVFNVTYAEAIEKLHNSEIKTVPAIIALQWLQLNRDKIRKMWG